MRKLILSFMLAALLGSCHQITRNETSNGTEFPMATNAGTVSEDSSMFTEIEWLDNDLDLGKVKEGQKVDVAFRFRNTGKKPLIIYSVNPACGCTAAEPPKEPILPGAEGVINASFDSKGRVGTNQKSIGVYTNTFGTTNHNLVFKVEVEKN